MATGQGILGNNMLAYCLNSPVNYYDSGGTAAISVCNGDRNPLLIGHIGLGYGGGGGGSGGSGYGDILEEAAGKTNRVLSTALDAFNYSYAVQQEQQIREIEATLDAAASIYDYVNKTNVVSIGKSGYQSYKAADEFRIAMAYLFAPMPTPADELFAIGHAIKGAYHLYKCIQEVAG